MASSIRPTTGIDLFLATAGRFRYEVRRWREGIIPDVGEAVESLHRLSEDADRARRLLKLVP